MSILLILITNCQLMANTWNVVHTFARITKWELRVLTHYYLMNLTSPHTSLPSKSRESSHIITKWELRTVTHYCQGESRVLRQYYQLRVTNPLNYYQMNLTGLHTLLPSEPHESSHIITKWELWVLHIIT